MDACIHYLTQNLADVPDNEDWLSEKEQALVSGLRFPKRRNDWRLGRWTAKRACCMYQSIPERSMPEMDVMASEDGGPDIYIRGGCASVSISISHSHGRGFCVTAPGSFAVGCDLEWTEYESPDFFDDYFLQEETRFCREAPEAIKSVSGYLIWSAKESCLKVLREGLRRDTRSVRIDVGLENVKDSWNPWTGHCVETSILFHGWWSFKDGFVYTLASNRPNQAPCELHTESGLRSKV
jgi:4'-phosphopantetheinyl transferase